jgi:hypothetical protein
MHLALVDTGLRWMRGDELVVSTRAAIPFLQLPRKGEFFLDFPLSGVTVSKTFPLIFEGMCLYQLEETMKRKPLSKSMTKTLELLSAMASGMRMNQAAGCGYHGNYKLNKRERRDNRLEARSVKRGWHDEVF